METNIFYHGDSLQLMKEFPDECADLVIAHPPFKFRFNKNRSDVKRDTGDGFLLPGYERIKLDNYETFTRTWLNEVKRLTKETGNIAWICHWKMLRESLNFVHEVGLEMFADVVWKYNTARPNRNGFTSIHFHVLMLCKDNSKRKFNQYARFGPDEKDEEGRPKWYHDSLDVWDIKNENWRNVIRTDTNTPIEYSERIVSYLSEEGDLVLDPFTCSGQCSWAAHKLGRKFIGIDIVRTFYEFASMRIELDKYTIERPEFLRMMKKRYDSLKGMKSDSLMPSFTDYYRAISENRLQGYYGDWIRITNRDGSISTFESY